MPRLCGKSFFLYSSSLPQQAQAGSDGSGRGCASVTTSPHAGHDQVCGPGRFTRPDTPHFGQNTRRFTNTSTLVGRVCNPSLFAKRTGYKPVQRQYVTPIGRSSWLVSSPRKQKITTTYR